MRIVLTILSTLIVIVVSGLENLRPEMAARPHMTNAHADINEVVENGESVSAAGKRLVPDVLCTHNAISLSSHR
jgi:hypothetical protein